MDAALHALIDFVSDHAGSAYAVVGLAALLEALPIVGSIVPGSTVIVAVSALASSGRLSIWVILASAVAGAAIGDGAAFWSGHRIKRRLLEVWPLSDYPHLVAQSEEFFRRHGTLAVLFARFVPPIRAFVPITAGALAMPPRRFFAINIPAVMLWAAVHVLSSAAAGSLFSEWGARIEPYALPTIAAISVVAVIGFAVWSLRRWQLCAPHLIHLSHPVETAQINRAKPTSDSYKP